MTLERQTPTPNEPPGDGRLRRQLRRNRSVSLGGGSEGFIGMRAKAPEMTRLVLKVGRLGSVQFVLFLPLILSGCGTPQAREEPLPAVIGRELFGSQYNDDQHDAFWQHRWNGSEVQLECRVTEVYRDGANCRLADGSNLVAYFEPGLQTEAFLAISRGANVTIEGTIGTRPKALAEQAPTDPEYETPCQREETCMELTVNAARIVDISTEK